MDCFCEPRKDLRELRTPEWPHPGYSSHRAPLASTTARRPHADARTAAYGILETVNCYCQSKDREITMRHTPVFLDGQGPSAADNYDYANQLVGQARLLWSEMVKPGSRVLVTHDVYLKLWAVSGPRLSYSTILLDEAQDTSELMIDVLRRQTHAQLVIWGDENQAIYAGAAPCPRWMLTRRTATLSDRSGSVRRSPRSPTRFLRGTAGRMLAWRAIHPLP